MEETLKIFKNKLEANFKDHPDHNKIIGISVACLVQALAETKTVNVNNDDYAMIQMTKETLGITEHEAVSVLTEIGLFNIIHFPCGNTSQVHRKIDEILKNGKYPQLVEKIKSVWKQ